MHILPYRKMVGYGRNTIPPKSPEGDFSSRLFISAQVPFSIASIARNIEQS